MTEFAPAAPTSDAVLGTYTLDEDRVGYDAGTVLYDVPWRVAQSWECNRCGDCCDSNSPDIKTDRNGSPQWVWGSNAPDDFYENRYGERTLIPLVRGDGELVPGDDWERDADGERVTWFRCRFLDRSEEQARCELYDRRDPADPSIMRPLNCGTFPVFGNLVTDAIIFKGSMIPAVGALPRCTWYGIRLVGPLQHTPGWVERYEKQQRGEPVPDLGIPPEVVAALVAKQEQRRG